MKERDFIVGNWYKSKYNNYFKFLKFENDYFYSSEEIVNNKWKASPGRKADGVCFVFKEIYLIEIAHLLPDDHPDLIIKQEIINDLSHVEPLIKLLEEIKNKKYV